jgi:uncharacterized membrane protein
MGVRRLMQRGINIVVAAVIAVTGLGGAQVHAIGEDCPIPFTTSANLTQNVDSNSELVKAGDGAMWTRETGSTPTIARIASNGTVSEFTLPSQSGSITKGSDGNIWFTNGDSTSPELSHITSSGVVTSTAISINGLPLHNLALGSDGAFWGVKFVPNQGSFTTLIEKVATDGTATEYPITTSPSVPSSNASNLVSGPDGNIWFMYGEGIVRMDISSGAMVWFSTGLSGDQFMRSFVSGPDNALWYVAYDQSDDEGFLGRMATNGTHTEFHNSRFAGVGAPSFMAVGDDGNLWLSTGNGIERFALSTHTVENYLIQTQASGVNYPGLQSIAAGTNSIWSAGIQQKLYKFDLTNVPTIATPQNFASSVAPYTPTFAWQSVSGATSYLICRDGIVTDTTASANYADSTATEATHYFSVIAKDSSGHLSSPSFGVELFVDRYAPTLSTPSLTNNPMLPGQTSKLSVDATDNNGIDHVQLSIDGGSPLRMHKACVGIGCGTPTNTWEFNFPTDGADCGIGCSMPYTFDEEGVHTLILNAVDNTGRLSAPRTIIFTIGLVPPTTVSIASSPTKNAPVLNWTAVTGADHYVIYRDGGSSPIGTSTTPSYTDSASLSDGTHTYTVTTADAASNESAHSSSASVVVDKTVPTVSSMTLTPTTILFTGTLSIGANAADTLSGVVSGEYYIDTDPGQGNGTPMTYNASTGKISGTRSISNGAFSIGNHTVYVRSKDAAGNWSTAVSKTFFYL